MPNLENKIQYWEAVVVGFKKLLIQVGIVVAVVGSIIITIVKNPEVVVEFATGLTEKFIHDQIVTETDKVAHNVVHKEFEHIMSEKYAEDSAKIYNNIKNVMTHLQSHRINNRTELNNVIQVSDDLKKQVEYQSKLISYLVQALSEQMDRKTDCPFDYYEAHSKGKWVRIKSDAYSTDALYPVEARGQRCDGYYTDALHNSRIQLR